MMMMGDASSSRKTARSTGGRGGPDSSSSSSMSISATAENMPAPSSSDEAFHESFNESMNSSSQDLHARHHHPTTPFPPSVNPSSSHPSTNDTTQRHQTNNSNSNNSNNNVVNPAILVSHGSNGRRRYRKIFVWVVVAGCIVGCYQNLFVQSMMKTIKTPPSSGVAISTANKEINATMSSDGESHSSVSVIAQEITDVTSTTETIDRVHEGSINDNNNDNDNEADQDFMGGGAGGDGGDNSKRTISNDDQRLRFPGVALAKSRVVQLNQLLSSYHRGKNDSTAKIEIDRLAVNKSIKSQRMKKTAVVLEPPDDIDSLFPIAEETTNNNSGIIGRSMELSSSLDDEGGDQQHFQQNYRTFERDWFEQCEDVTTTKRSVPTQGEDGEDINGNEHRIMVHPTCNQFHELDVASDDDDGDGDDDVDNHHGPASIERNESASTTPSSNNIELLSMQGSWRSVWKISTAIAPSSTSVILKMLQLDREFDDESFKMHQMDAIVMDKLTASSRIVDSYGFCGQSVMTQAATISSGGKALKGGENPKASKSSKASSKSQSSWVGRLNIARDTALGLAELHALSPYDMDVHRNQSSSSIQGHLRKTKKTTTTTTNDLVFAHHDINPSNVIGVEGRVLFNDFNLGILKRQQMYHQHNQDQNASNLVEPLSSDNTTFCPVPIRYYSSLWRSPEEIENKTGYLEDTNTNPHAAQAADVYSLGNLLFIILTKHQPWWHLEEPTKPTLDEIATFKLEGRLPHVPDKFLSSVTIQNSDDARGSNNGTLVVPILAAHDLWTIAKMCYRLNPSDRPTALEVAILLDRAHRDEIKRIKSIESSSMTNKTKKVKNHEDDGDKTKDKDKATRRMTSKTV